MGKQKVNQISARVILGLSLFAMLLIVGATVLTMFGLFHASPDYDEGVAAHLFQLAIVLLLPTGLAFLVTAEWRQPLMVARCLFLPAVALGVAFSTLYYMEHML